MNALIGVDDTFALLTVLLCASAMGIVGERLKWYGKVSGVIVTITLTAILVSINAIPSASSQDITVPLYDAIFSYVVPLSIPLLLFNVNIRRVIKQAGRLVIAFLAGTIGIAIGVVIAFYIVPIGPEGYKVAAVYSATYIGGSVNFIAVADALSFIESPLFPATIAVDNVFTNLYLILLFVLPTWTLLRKFVPYEPQRNTFDGGQNENKESAPKSGYDMSMLENITLAVLIASGICAVGIYLSPLLEGVLNTEVKLEILIITGLIVIAGNIFPKLFQRLEYAAFQVGFFLMYIFLAVIGAACDVREIIASTPTLLLFVAIALTIHFVCILLVCKFFKISLEELSIASAANVAGSTVSAPMSIALRLKELVTAAVVIGTLGNVIGTFIGVGIGLMLK